MNTLERGLELKYSRIRNMRLKIFVLFIVRKATSLREHFVQLDITVKITCQFVKLEHSLVVNAFLYGKISLRIQ